MPALRALIPAARRALAALLDLAALLALLRALASQALGPLLPVSLRSDDAARDFRSAVILAAVRVLLETRRALWLRLLAGPPASDDEDASARVGAFSALAAGAAGASAVVLGFGLAHPRTHLPSSALLVPLALVAGGVPGGILGLAVTAAAPFLRRIRLLLAGGAPRRLAVVLAAGGAAALALEANPGNRWTTPPGAPAWLAVSGGALLLVAVLRGLLAVGPIPGRGRRRAVTGLLAAAVAAGLVVLATPAGLPAGTAPAGWPRAVLLVTMDTTRADHLGCYGYARDTSPRVDALARESVLFEHAYAGIPTTDPSHAALLTGLQPRTTGVMANGYHVTRPEGARTLAGWFLDRGYRTGAITSRLFLDPVSLRLPGFQTFSAPTDRCTEADLALGRARTWLDRHGEAPFFLWVHLWDPHGPYDPPREPERSMFVGTYRGEFHKESSTRTGLRKKPYSRAVIDYAVGLYDGEIRYADDHVGQLVEEVRRRYGRENVLVVLAADHGESLDEMDGTDRWAFAHSHFLTRPTLHVPLLFSWPGHLPEGRRVDVPVSTVGLTPTLTALLGDEMPGDLPSFHRLLTGEPGDPGAPSPVLAERQRYVTDPPGRPYLTSPELAAIEGRLLYVENTARGRFLFDMAEDPRSERNLLEARPEIAERLSSAIRLFLLAHPQAPDLDEPFSDEMDRALQGLGYLGGR